MDSIIFYKDFYCNNLGFYIFCGKDGLYVFGKVEEVGFNLLCYVFFYIIIYWYR